MKMKWMPVVALMLGALTVPTLAQDMGGDAEAEARTVELKEAYKAGWVITEKEVESGSSTGNLAGMMERLESNTGEKTKVTEVLEVNEDGQITKARVSWKDGKSVTELQDFGEAEMGEPVEEENSLNGVVILYTHDAEKDAWTAKLEEGDAENEDVKEELEEANPFFNAFMPNKEVAVGESWEVSEEDLKKMFGDSDAIEVKDISATCTVDEVREIDGVEFAKVSFEVEGTNTLKDEDLGNPDMPFTMSGHYLFDLKNKRAASVEMERTFSIATQVQTPQGAMDLTMEGEGEATMTMTYAAKKEEGAGDEGK